jgi:hypothetical protein
MCAWVRSTLAGLDGFFEVQCGARNLGYAIPEGPRFDSVVGVGVGTEQVWRHGYTGFLLATYGHRQRNISAVWASRPCAPSGPPANAPGPQYGIANGRNAGTCRGGGPLGGLLCDVAVLGAFTDPWPLFSTFAASKMSALSPRAWFFSATALDFTGTGTQECAALYLFVRP